MKKRPLIGISPDIEHREGSPSRDFYFMCAKTPEALHAVGGDVVMLSHEIAQIDRYLEAVDGVFISGGGFQFPDRKLFSKAHEQTAPPEKIGRTRFERRLFQRALEIGLPIFGVCGGFQSMNVFLGGSIVVNLTEENPDWDHLQKPYTQAVHDVVVKQGTLLHRIVGMGRFPVNSIHSQGVVEVGESVVASGSSPDGVVEAIELPGAGFCLATQWHPEFHISGADEKILAAFVRAAADYKRA